MIAMCCLPTCSSKTSSDVGTTPLPDSFWAPLWPTIAASGTAGSAQSAGPFIASWSSSNRSTWRIVAA